MFSYYKKLGIAAVSLPMVDKSALNIFTLSRLHLIVGTVIKIKRNQ